MDKLPENKLFEGIPPNDTEKMLNCFGARREIFGKGSSIYRAGYKPHSVVLILSGSAEVVSFDYWGNKTLYSQIKDGDIFGAAYGETDKLPVDVLTDSGCTALLIPYEKILSPCGKACGCHSQLLRNMIRILAEKNMSQIEKMGHLTKRTLRGKILSYLSSASRGEKYFEIPFSRQQLADFLAVDRAALSREIGRLAEEGIISCSRRNFRIIDEKQ